MWFSVVQCWFSIVQCWFSNVQCWFSSVQCWFSIVQCRFSIVNVGFPLSNVGFPLSSGQELVVIGQTSVVSEIGQCQVLMINDERVYFALQEMTDASKNYNKSIIKKRSQRKKNKTGIGPDDNRPSTN